MIFRWRCPGESIRCALLSTLQGLLDTYGDALGEFPHRVVREMRCAGGGLDVEVSEQPADDRQAPPSDGAREAESGAIVCAHCLVVSSTP